MSGALDGLVVLDVSTLFAGPIVATLLGDYGAAVTKIEHPKGDPLRTMGWRKDDINLIWLFINRNKEVVSLSLSTPDGQDLFRELVAGADVVIENFRPGVMERWGLGWDELSALNPRLVMVRMTGFGQDGPYRNRPGYGTLAESLSGFAHINGAPDGPPMLPPLALADGIAGTAGAFATLAALRHRDATGAGQMVDVAIYEPLFWILGAQATLYDQLGIVQERTGNRTPFSAPRNSFRSSDGRWLGLSAGSTAVAARVARLIGRPDFVEEPWFADHLGRIAHQDELEDAIAEWVGKHTADEVIAAFEAAEAAIAPMYSMADIARDPHYRARETITTVEHPDLGPVEIPNLMARLTGAPGKVRHLGRHPGADNEAVLGKRLGHSADELAAWREAGVI